MAAFRKRNSGWRDEVCIKGVRTELWSSLVFRSMNQAAAWLISVTSIPSLNLIPI